MKSLTTQDIGSPDYITGGKNLQPHGNDTDRKAKSATNTRATTKETTEMITTGSSQLSTS